MVQRFPAIEQSDGNSAIGNSQVVCFPEIVLIAGAGPGLRGVRDPL